MAVRTLTVTLSGDTAYSQSRAHTAPELNDKEGKDAYEERTWREKAHYDPTTGEVYIPGMGIKQAIDTAAKRLSIPIKGKGKATYTKNVASGVLVIDNVKLGMTKDELLKETIHANSDGIRGSGKRVFRHFPLIPRGWKGKATLTVVDDELPNDVVERCLREAGKLVGVGRFRAEKGGSLGRFTVSDAQWTELT